MNILRKFFFEKRALAKLIFFVLIDSFLIATSAVLAFVVRFEGVVPERYYLNILGIILLALIINPLVFYFFRLYHFTWSYVSTRELVQLVKGMSLSFLLLTGLFFILRDVAIFSGFPRSTLFITYFFIFVLSGGLRFAKRIYLSSLYGGNLTGRERTLIVGAGDTGEQILRSILSSFDSSYFPVGFVDDSSLRQNISIHGVKILGKISDIQEIVKKNQISQLIVALPSANSKSVKDAVDLGRKSGIKKIKIFPSLSEIIRTGASLKDLKDMEVEDLLGRDSVSFGTSEIEKLIKNKVILITGAAGSIGSELSRQTVKFHPKVLILLDQDETGIFNITQELNYIFPDLKIESLVADIKDKEKINSIFDKYQPQIIFHAAAYKHVPLMEDNPDQAIKNNIFGTKNLTEACLKNKTEKFIFISTDKAVNPTSVMGITKRIGEIICQSCNQKNTTKFISVRFGNVLDSRGSVIPIFREQIKRGGPVEVTHPEMKRYFMLNSEACLLVLQAGAMGQGGEVFVLDMGEPIKILDLAKKMIKLSGFEPDKDIAIVFTGTRPGEKLFEEILTAEEGTVATKHQRIFTAKTPLRNSQNLLERIEKLQDILLISDKQDLVKALKKIISSSNVNE
ncbi:MAG: nucleoside-diphosphate sugar epimerase/dehydratase [Candidatus Staskawiczbacteria bacterium]|nr:nucleoside-diphosphate sugar epimerase/dehydratase [Candidatus Staskawiczbacteria bacterium]